MARSFEVKSSVQNVDLSKQTPGVLARLGPIRATRLDRGGSKRTRVLGLKGFKIDDIALQLGKGEHRGVANIGRVIGSDL